jgi:hypothetical protein
MRFINEKLHGVIDYVVAIALITAPFLLDFQSVNPTAHWLSIAAGVGLFLYSLLTSYSLSARKLIPFGVHLVFDFLAGVVFLAAPFALNFDGTVRTYYLAVGAAIVLVVLLTDPKVSAANAAAA